MSDKSHHLGRREFIAFAGTAAAVLPFSNLVGATEAEMQAPQRRVYVHEITMATPDVICVEVRDPPIIRGAFVAIDAPESSNYDDWLLRPNPKLGGRLDYCRVVGAKKMHLRFQDIRATEYLNRSSVDQAVNYGPIGSRKVVDVYRKSMPYMTGLGRFNLSSRAPIPAVSSKHFLYLKLDGLVSDGVYSIQFPLDARLPEMRFVKKEKSTRAISIRATQNGHRPRDANKFGYLSLWVPGAPENGAIDFSKYGIGDGTAFHIIDAHDTIVFTGSIALRIGPTEAERVKGFTYPNTRYTEAYPRIVTNVTTTSPAVVTSPSHGYTNGDKVVFAGMEHFTPGARSKIGMKNLNYTGNDKVSEFTVANATPDTFELAAVDASRFSPFATDLSGHGGNYVFRTYEANRAGTFVYGLDYSAFTPKIRGLYRIYIPVLGVSDPFSVDETVHFKTAQCSSMGEYHQRSGIALDGRFGYARPVSFRSGFDRTIYKTMVPLAFSREFTDVAVRGFVKPINYDQSGKVPWITTIEAPNAWGGWHDGGDWDSRLTAIGLPCFMLMDVWEHLPAQSRDVSFGLPKSSEILDPQLYAGTDGLSDVLHSAIFLLDFHRRMQESSGATSGGTDNQEKENLWEPSWLYRGPVTVYYPDHVSTFIYAGLAAKLARILVDLGFTGLASTYRTSAIAAWDWAEAIHTDQVRRDNHYGYLKISSGSQQGYLTDEEYRTNMDVLKSGVMGFRMLAAACLLALTGEARFREPIRVPNDCIGSWGAAAWEASNTKYLIPSLRGTLRRALVARADARYIAYSNGRNAYRNLQVAGFASMAYGGAGTSMIDSGQAMIWAHKITGRPIYLEALQSNIAFIQGANQNGMSLTNGIGVRNLTETLHRDVQATGDALPLGLTSEGWGNKFSVDFSRGQSFISYIQEPNADTAIANLSTPPGDYLPQRELTPRYSFSFPLFEKLIECWLAIEQMEFTTQQNILPQIYVGLYLHGWDGNATRGSL